MTRRADWRTERLFSIQEVLEQRRHVIGIPPLPLAAGDGPKVNLGGMFAVDQADAAAWRDCVRALVASAPGPTTPSSSVWLGDCDKWQHG
jgi:hypothetical protein